MKKIALLLAVFPLLGYAAEGDFRQLLVGTWTYTAHGCSESITYRADGTRSTISGDEQTDSVYTLEALDKTDDAYRHAYYTAGGRLSFSPKTPRKRVSTRNGIYQVQITVIKDHGGTDCPGDDMDDTGASWTNILMFNKNKTQFTSCGDPDLPCFGPYTKQPR